MKDEIKEILDRLNNAMTDNNCIDRKLAKRYYDAIINLQEENKKLLKKSYSDDVKITKAIELLEPLIELNGVMTTKGMYKLLNILNGDDE